MPGGWEWLIVIAVLVLLFGAKRLPDMARSIGQSARVFKGEMKGLKGDEEKAATAEPAAEQAPAAPLPPAAPTVAAPKAAAPAETVPQDQQTRTGQ